MTQSAWAEMPPRRRGACPSAGAELASGDGLLSRVRLPGGRITAPDFDRVAALAKAHGNGLVQVTRRGNLQIRGLTPTSSARLTSDLVEAGLAVTPPAAEAARNILAGPVADLDPTAWLDPFSVAHALDRRLCRDERLWALPPKFRFAVCGGGHHPANLDADLRADAVPGESGLCYRLALAGTPATARPLGWCRPDEAAAVLAALARRFVELNVRRSEPVGRLATLLADTGDQSFRQLDGIRVGNLEPPALATRDTAPGPHEYGFELGIPFGQLDSSTARWLAALSRNRGDGTLRLTPQRRIVLPGLDHGAVGELAQSGLVTGARDPRTALVACPGAGGCLSGTTFTRDHARDWARAVPELFDDGSLELHVSGCAKGCARSWPAPLTLTARAGGYDLMLDGGPEPCGEDRVRAGLAPESVPDVLYRLARFLESRAGAGESRLTTLRRLGRDAVRQALKP